LKQLDPTTLLWRVGAEPIGLSGEELIASSQQLAVIGWMDSATRAARAAKIFTKILRVVRTHKIDAAVLIDSPAFNLKLAKALKKGGVRVFYYVSRESPNLGMGSAPHQDYPQMGRTSFCAVSLRDRFICPRRYCRDICRAPVV
jgi:hypothetical protein